MSFLKPDDLSDTTKAIQEVPFQLVASPWELGAYTLMDVAGMYIQDQLPIVSDSLLMQRVYLGLGEAIKMRASMIINNVVVALEAKRGTTPDSKSGH